MGTSERFVILVPAVFTVLVVVLVENTYNVRSSIAPFIHHVASAVAYHLGALIDSVKG